MPVKEVLSNPIPSKITMFSDILLYSEKQLKDI